MQSTNAQPLWRPLSLILLFVFIDVMGYSIVMPLMPYMCERFGASPLQVGALAAFNSVAQLIASPFLGTLSDRKGRRPVLLACIAATFVSFAMLATASSLAIVFLSRVLDGLFGGNASLARAYLTGNTPPPSVFVTISRANEKKKKKRLTCSRLNRSDARRKGERASVCGV
jgi:MFS transporter, DHA1 family, tetracycline resistance protein